MSLSCSGDNLEPIPGEASLRKLYEMTVTSTHGLQDYHRVLKIYEDSNDIKDGERTSIAGLAYIYQAEVYLIVGDLLSMIQLDLFLQSRDPEHGHKFPVDMSGLSNTDSTQLRRLLVLDIWRIHGSDAALTCLDDRVAGYSEQEKDSISRIINNEDRLWTKWIGDRDVFAAIGRDQEAWKVYTEGTACLREGDYRDAIDIVSNSMVCRKDHFEGNKYVSYYDPLTYYLLADAYYKRGIQVLNTALNLEYVTPDSSKFRMMNAVTLLGALAQYEQEMTDIGSHIRLIESDYFHANQGLFNNLVCEYPYRLAADWLFSRSGTPSKSNLTLSKSGHIQDCQVLQSDYIMKIISNYLVNKDQVPSSDIESVLAALDGNPEEMDKYPIILPFFLSKLCISEYRFRLKSQIQTICERLIFDVTRSSNSLIRNRPAFLLSTISVFRWHGGRLPDGIGFLIELGERDQGLYPLHQLLKIFINQLIE